MVDVAKAVWANYGPAITKWVLGIILSLILAITSLILWIYNSDREHQAKHRTNTANKLESLVADVGRNSAQIKAAQAQLAEAKKKMADLKARLDRLEQTASQPFPHDWQDLVDSMRKLADRTKNND